MAFNIGNASGTRKNNVPNIVGDKPPVADPKLTNAGFIKGTVTNTALNDSTAGQPLLTRLDEILSSNPTANTVYPRAAAVGYTKYSPYFPPFFPPFFPPYFPPYFPPSFK